MSADEISHDIPTNSPDAGAKNRIAGFGTRLIRVLLVPAIIIGVGFGPVLLHCAQKSHNQLPFDPMETFPADKPMVPGEAFATTQARIMDHELSGVTGWRPNDIVLWGPGLWADNNSNRQLGIIQATRESTRVFRDHLTKISATEYDPNLVDADTKLRNDEFKWWFPSAERRFGESAAALRIYVEGLQATPSTSEPINRRNVELIRLFQAWTDLLGDAHSKLIREAVISPGPEEVSWWLIDNQFYHAQGFAHVMAPLTRAVRREYAKELGTRSTILDMFDRITRSLERAASLKPFIVLEGGADGLFANHRRNLDAYLVDARQLMYSVREELEK